MQHHDEGACDVGGCAPDRTPPEVAVAHPVFTLDLVGGGRSNRTRIADACGMSWSDVCTTGPLLAGIVDVRVDGTDAEVVGGEPGAFVSDGAYIDWHDAILDLDRAGVGERRYTVTYAVIDGADNWAYADCVLDVVDPRADGVDGCNGLDDDGDGAVDEDFTVEATQCGVGACASTGATACIAGAVTNTCDAGSPTDEICANGVDDDCDGLSDELACAEDGCAPDADPPEITVAVPVVEYALAAGYVPNRDRIESACGLVWHDACGNRDLLSGIVEVRVESTTDERIDDGPGAFQSEGIYVDWHDFILNLDRTIVGPRRYTLTYTAIDAAGNRGFADCEIRIVDPLAPPPEQCNGADDDDDDGTIDEGFDTGAPCESGLGVCARPGVTVCRADGTGTVCDAVPGPRGEERCDGVDGDCDGEIDEGFAGLGEPCAAGVGACRQPGSFVCDEDGATVVCDAVAAPAERVECETTRSLDFADDYGCKLRTDGGVVCWGHSSVHRQPSGPHWLGVVAGDIGPDTPPIDLGSRRADAISFGTANVCVRLEDGDVKCWGANDRLYGAGPDAAATIDDPETRGDQHPAVGLGAGARALEVEVGENRACAVVDDGTVRCWGDISPRRIGERTRIEWGANRMGRESNGARIEWGANRMGRESNGARIEWGANRMGRDEGERAGAARAPSLPDAGAEAGRVIGVVRSDSHHRWRGHHLGISRARRDGPRPAVR